MDSESVTLSEKEYKAIAHSIITITTVSSANPGVVIDMLTGYLWSEEEAGGIKEFCDLE